MLRQTEPDSAIVVLTSRARREGTGPNLQQCDGCFGHPGSAAANAILHATVKGL